MAEAPELPDPEELEERRDKAFSRRVALTTAIYAVVLAIASLGGNNAMKEMRLAQQEATNPVFVTSLVLALVGAFFTFTGDALLFGVPFLSSH